MTDESGRLPRALARWVQGCVKHARAIVLGLCFLSLGLGAYAATHLGINSDNTRMVAEDLPSSRAHAAFSALFPTLDNAVLIVIDAPQPGASREAAKQLAERLRLDSVHFRDVFQPGGGEFFRRNGLLYRSVDELEEFADQTIRLQPLLAELERDPSVGNFAMLVRQGLEQVRLGESGVSASEWSNVLDRIGQAAVAVYDEGPLEISWDEVLLRDSAIDASTRAVLVVDPVLDFQHLLPAREPLAAIRRAAADVAGQSAVPLQIRTTGNPILNYEEMLGLAWDVGIGGLVCFLLVALVVHRACRSWPMVAAALTTLLAGLTWTAAFAAAAVGDLNIVSITFAILFIGLGIDFAIHLGMQYVLLRAEGEDHLEAILVSARGVGSSLVLCTVTTSIGFFVFVPTDYRGVAELGLIAGTGMGISLFMTLTLFPALLTWAFPVDAGRIESSEFRLDSALFRWLEGRSRAILAVSALLAAGAAWLAPHAEFDPDVLRMRDPDTQSVRVFEELLDDNQLTSPWFANVVTRDLNAAQTLARELRALEPVGRVVTIADYVPGDQQEKREILADVGMVFDLPETANGGPQRAPSAEFQVDALRELEDFLAQLPLQAESLLSSSVRSLRDELRRFLERVDSESRPDRALASLEEILLADLPSSMAQLRAAVAPEIITLDGLPAQLRKRMLAPAGQARIQIFPQQSLGEKLALERFVDSVHTVAPSATGLAPSIVSFGHVTVSSLEQALLSAVVAIALLLYALWRRVADVVLVIAPLLLGTTLTVATMALLELPFNFANVIVLPLLLGIGVDSGIHLVHRARDESLAAGALLGTTTARAVFYSALTTLASFGSLSLSSHRGMQSLGVLLVVGLCFTLFANLIVLPALLSETRRRSFPGRGVLQPAESAD